MTPKMPTYKATAQLVQGAKTFRFSVRNMPREAVQGYPVPVVRGERLCLAFLFFVMRTQPPSPPEIMPPGWIMYIDAESGEERGVDRQPVDLEKPAGTHQLPPGLTRAQFDAKQKRLAALMDKLLPLVPRYPEPSAPELRQTIGEFRNLWQELSHKPLTHAYRDLNPQWFDYLGIK